MRRKMKLWKSEAKRNRKIESKREDERNWNAFSCKSVTETSISCRMTQTKGGMTFWIRKKSVLPVFSFSKQRWYDLSYWKNSRVLPFFVEKQGGGGKESFKLLAHGFLQILLQILVKILCNLRLAYRCGQIQ